MSNNYIIFTDSSCDLTAKMAEELELAVLPLAVNIEGKEYFNYLDGREIGFKEFYDLIREGKMATTSAPNVQAFRDAIEPKLKEGKDILYIGFSSALSGTYSAGATACAQLAEEYPERKLYAVESLAASQGQGMLVYYAAQKRKEGASIEKVKEFVEKSRLHLAHWFTVDDLGHLKKGGRISPATAAIGTMLNIKPVMHVDDEGRLVAVGKVRGRKASFKEIVSTMERTVIEPEKQTIFITHGDCLDEAETLAAMIREKMTVQDVVINYVGPVIGAHTGPGVIALFFWAKER